MGSTSDQESRRGRLLTFSVDVSPLKTSRPYRYLLIGQVVSLIGTQMRYVAVSWQVFTVTGSSAAVGLLGLAEVIPLLLFTPLAGLLADSADRKRIMVHAQATSMGASLGLFGVSLMSEPPLWSIYALTTLAATFDALDRPARTAVIPSLVGPSKIASALALRQVSFQISQIIGPALGGIAIASLSIASVYAVDAASFVASLMALRAVPRSAVTARKQKASELVREGLKFSLGRPLIRSTFAIDLIAMIFGMPRAVFPSLAADVFDIGARGVGVLYAAPSFGALLGALLSGWVNAVQRFGRAIFLIVTVWGLAITLAGLSAFSLPLMLFFLAVAGAADVLSAVFRGTVVQEATPDHLRGRVTSVNMLVVVGGPRLGDFEAGIAASILGPVGSIVSGGLACLAGTGVLWTRATRLREYRRERRH